MWPTSALIILSIAVYASATLITNDTSILSQSYDFVIVGGGTTALSVANRLSVNHTVLVVERGLDEMNEEGINNPFTTFSTTSGSVTCHRNSTTPPQIGSDGTQSRTLAVTYGNCLGGGSSINALVGTRPVKAGMDAIASLGNDGWGWDDFLPFLIKSETFGQLDEEQIADGATFNASVHGTSGPVGVAFSRPLIAPGMQAAAKNTSLSVYNMTISEDLGDGFSGGHIMSFYHHIHFNETLQQDRRSSSAWSYLYPQDQQRAGLTVLTSHIVDKIITSSEAKGVTATGVQILPSTGGDSIIFNASREVVVSAGTLFSPGVLMRSGIGEANALKNLNITPVLNLPGVGSNFQDQVLLLNISFPLNAAQLTNDDVTADSILVATVLGHPSGDNVFGPNGNEQVGAIIRNVTANTSLSLGAVVNEASFLTQIEAIATMMEQNHPLIEIFFTPGQDQLSLWTLTISPLSRGTITINSSDPLAFPIVNAQYLTVDADIDLFTRAARLLGEAASTPPLSDLLSADAYALSGLPAVNASDDAWKTWMFGKYTPGIHYVGSLSMMPKVLGGVVSDQLLVYGTTNIRVADASIMPISVSPHTTLGLYGIGEKAADMILKTASASESQLLAEDV